MKEAVGFGTSALAKENTDGTSSLDCLIKYKLRLYFFQLI